MYAINIDKILYNDIICSSHMTLKEIAKNTNVSLSTVSRVLNKKDGIGKEKRREIEILLQKHGFLPKSFTKIAVVMPDLGNPFFSELVKEISGVLQNKNSYLMVFDSDEKIENESVITTMITRDKSIDGVVLAIVGGKESEDNLNKLIDSGKPVVLLDRELDFNYCGVFLDDFRAGFLATETLIKDGHSNIAVISANTVLKNIYNRYNGFLYALKKYSMNFDEKGVIIENLKFDGGQRGMSEILNSASLPTAVLILNNMMTLGALNLLSGHKSAHEKLFIMGFDLPYFVTMKNKNLAYISRSIPEMGIATAELIIEKLNSDSNYIRKIILEPQLIRNY